MITCAAVVVPNITLPIWVKMLRSAVDKYVDNYWFIVDGPAMERVGGVPELEFADSHVTVARGGANHGREATQLVQQCRETLLIVEDDCFLTPKADDLLRHIKVVEGGEFGAISACLGGSEGDFIAKSAELWPDCAESSEFDTYGPGFWPNMTILDLNEVRRLTDGDMCSRSVPAGVPIAEMGGWSPPVASGLDVAGWLGLQFRARGGSVKRWSQYRATPYPRCAPVRPYASREAPWIHIGQGSYLPRWQRRQDAQGAGFEASVACFEACARLALSSASLRRWTDEAWRTVERCKWARDSVGFDAKLCDAWALAMGPMFSAL